MNFISQLYDFLAGPCLFITLPLCFAGLARKTISVLSGLNHGLRFRALQTQGYITAGFGEDDSVAAAVTLAGRDPVLAAASTMFHIAIFAAPLTAVAHGILLNQAWKVMPPLFNPAVTGACTMTALISGMFLLIRRTFLRHVIAVSTWRDYAAMISVLIPFVTGFLARESIGPYEIIMIIHSAGAHILLLAIGWTRLGHMVFFAAVRITASDLRRENPA